MIITDNLELDKAVKYLPIYTNINNSSFQIEARVCDDKGYSVEKNYNKIDILYHDKSSFFCSLLDALSLTKNQEKIARKLDIKNVGLMYDCARNAVINIESIKKIIVQSALMGYNYLELYLEDCLEVVNEPYFGYLRGKYLISEIKEIDNFAKLFGIELVPCIQTLAHLNQIFRWEKYTPINDCNDILLAEDERTYELLENIFKSVREAFSSKKINIGMDEAHMVGLGKYLKINGFKERFDILLQHLNKVVLLCNKYEFIPSMWSDMFFGLAFNNYFEKEKDFDKNVIEKIPKGISLIYWDYFRTQKSDYDAMIKKHKTLKCPVKFAGGIWTWVGFAPHNDFSQASMLAAIKSCKENDIDDIIFTMWGDNGGECSRFSTLSSQLILIENCFDKHDKQSLNKKAELLTGYDFNDLQLLDLPNKPFKSKIPSYVNPCKYLLFSDILEGFFDDSIKMDYADYYKKYAKTLSNQAKKANKNSYIFDTLSKLCSVLEVKSTLSLQIKQAYNENDLKSLLLIATKKIPLILSRINRFYNAFSLQWNIENKANGFDIQDIRIGGLLQRLKRVKSIILAYVSGNVDSIPELEEESKTILGKREINEDNICMVFNSYVASSSVNNF